MAHVYCGETAGWIRVQLGTEVGLGSGRIELDGYPAPPTESSTAAIIIIINLFASNIKNSTMM